MFLALLTLLGGKGSTKNPAHGRVSKRELLTP